MPIAAVAPGTPVEYDRTMFVPRISVAGPVQVQVGHLLAGDGERLPLTGRDRGMRAYAVATLEIGPTRPGFVAFGDGWHNPEVGRDARDASGTGRGRRAASRSATRSGRPSSGSSSTSR